jgi:hypothetical protein
VDGRNRFGHDECEFSPTHIVRSGHRGALLTRADSSLELLKRACVDKAKGGY